MPKQVTALDFPEIRWKGHWVWVPEEDLNISAVMPGQNQTTGQEAHAFFRRTVHIDAVPERAPARITADSRYALFVNGQEVFRGPVRSQPRRLFYDLFDLAPYLQAGQNTIAIYVKYYGRANSFWIPAAPNSVLGRSGVLVFEADLGPAGWLVSDPSWKARKFEAWSSVEGSNMVSAGVPVEVFDARKMPTGWREADFDDSEWGNARPVPAVHIGGFAHTQPPTDPYGPLYPRTIAKLDGDIRQPQSVRAEKLQGDVDTSVSAPIERVNASIGVAAEPLDGADTLPLELAIQPGRPARLLLDMGGIVSGLVQLRVSAPAGMVFDLGYVEEPMSGGQLGFGLHAGTRYIARGAQDDYEVFDSNGFRYAYILVHGASGAVTVEHFAVRELIYPWQPGASFECSDEDLNRLYTAGIRTVQLNSHDAFLDCPTREQRAWVGDSVVHQMVHLTTNTDWRLAWQYLTLGNSPRSDGILPMSVAGEIEWSGAFTIPDWALHWIHGVYNLYRFNGDQDQVKAYMPTIERILRWYAPFQTAEGVLKDVVEWNLVDWASLHVEDTSSILTAIWARGLREFAEMAGWLEENASRRWAEKLYEQIREGYEMFWDEERGTYIDHIKDGQPQKPISQTAGALAIVSGLAPRERWPRIIDVITDPDRLVVRSWTGAETGEYSMEKMMKQMQGIYEADWDVEREVVIAQPFLSYVTHDAVALAGLADRLPDLYTRWLQFLKDGYDTIGECWGWGTHVHGWSCTPTRDLIFYTLGVTPDKPGYASARIAPRLGRLTWAKGVVPTPHGPITVEVRGNDVTVDSPIPYTLDLEKK
jgi:alpha-L-rhamnosidase